MTKNEWVAAAHTRFTRWARHRACRGRIGTIESLRAHIERDLDAPGDARWWGEVTLALKRDGVIRRTHMVAVARSSHHATKPVWRVC